VSVAERIEAGLCVCRGASSQLVRDPLREARATVAVIDHNQSPFGPDENSRRDSRQPVAVKMIDQESRLSP
jgi:hypothetical protein